jgi:transcriptional regulator with XRE-family HTH domain
MRPDKKFIGPNLIRHRNKKNMSQQDVASAVGMSQGQYSKIESDLQSPSDEQIAAFAAILDTTPEELTGSTPVVINGHVETQHGGNANSYVVQHNAELLAAKDEIIVALKGQITAKDALLAIKEEEIRLLKEKHRA